MLMLVTDPRHNLTEKVQSAVIGGVNMVQYRDYSNAPWEDKATQLTDLIKAAGKGVRIQLNIGSIIPSFESETRLLPLLSMYADQRMGLHLPEHAPFVEAKTARLIRFNGGFIGRSIHSPNAAVAAENEGCDYIVAGSVYATASHPGRTPLSIDNLQLICSSVSIPVIAIGGITPMRVCECKHNGAAGVAVLSGILDAIDPSVAARNYADQLKGIGDQPCS